MRIAVVLFSSALVLLVAHWALETNRLSASWIMAALVAFVFSKLMDYVLSRWP